MCLTIPANLSVWLSISIAHILLILDWGCTGYTWLRLTASDLTFCVTAVCAPPLTLTCENVASQKLPNSSFVGYWKWLFVSSVQVFNNRNDVVTMPKNSPHVRSIQYLILLVWVRSLYTRSSASGSQGHGWWCWHFAQRPSQGWLVAGLFLRGSVVRSCNFKR